MSAGIRAGVSNDGYIQVNGTDVVSLTTSSVTFNSTTVTFNGQVYGIQPTGMFANFMLPAAPAGWIAGDGTTIGNVGSGATRANADTLPLFTAWWAYTDAQLPILTSAGGASTRGVSAAADWAALKRLTVFDIRDRVARSAGTLQVNGNPLEDQMQGHIHALFTQVTASSTGGTVNGVNSTGSNVANTGVPVSDGTNGTPRTGTETRVKSLGMLGCFKL